MADRIVRVENESWGSRLSGSAKGIIVGLIMALIGVVLLFSNEGRAVRRAQALAEGASSVRSVAADSIDPALEGRLIHLSGRAESPEVLRDVTFRVSSDELKLVRSVSMYQWEEDRETKTEKKVGGGTQKETVITYEKTWSDRAISSSSFEEPAGHENPPFPVESETWTASPVTVGAFTLGDSFVSKIGSSQPLSSFAEGLPTEIVGMPVHVVGSEIYLGADPLRPQIGDAKVTFSVVPEGELSVVGQQQGGTLVPYTATNGQSIAELTRGIRSADQMFQAAKEGNRNLTWILRLAGFVILWIAFGLILRPLSVLADVVPMIGNVVGAGTGIIAGLGAAFVSLVVVAIGWIFYRPWLGILLLAVALAFLVWIVKRTMAARRDRRAAAPPSPPPASGVAPPPPPPPPPAS